MAVPVFLQQIGMSGSLYSTVITVTQTWPIPGTANYDLALGDAVFQETGSYEVIIPADIDPRLSVVMWGGGGGGAQSGGQGGHAGAARGVGLIGGEYRMTVAGGAWGGSVVSQGNRAGGQGGYGGGGGGGGIGKTTAIGNSGSIYGMGGAGGIDIYGNRQGASGGGGGASAIVAGTSIAVHANSVIVAAGGAGAPGYWYATSANGGGLTGEAKGPDVIVRGEGGTQTAGGAGGQPYPLTQFGSYSGHSGAAGIGGGGAGAVGQGNASVLTYAGGGGGGGYYGGGGGASQNINYPSFSRNYIEGYASPTNNGYQYGPGGGGSSYTNSSYFLGATAVYSGNNWPYNQSAPSNTYPPGDSRTPYPALEGDPRKPSTNTGRGGEDYYGNNKGAAYPASYYGGGHKGAVVFYLN